MATASNAADGIETLSGNHLPPEASLDAAADSLFEAVAAAPPRRPVSTYRLQLHAGFRLEAAEKAADYLHALGVSDLYLSPYLAAGQGSTHGYDVIDHGRVNPEVGDDATHARFVERLQSLGMGRVLDLVPNHMGSSTTNLFMLDVLENGPTAPGAAFFDIEWSPVKASLAGHVLFPVLEDLYGKVLERGLITIEREGGSFWVAYHERRLPLRPRTYADVLRRRPDAFREQFSIDDEDAGEYLSIADSAAHLDDHAVEAFVREKEVIKRRIKALCDASPRVRAFLDANVASFRGTPGDAGSFDALHELLEKQVYRLAYWRVASEEINFRRFFDVTGLAGIRVENPTVFDYAHRLPFSWVDAGGVTALRIDHPDGLADPLGYFQKLQERLFVQACRKEAVGRGLQAQWLDLEGRVVERFRRETAADPYGPLARRFPIVAEKILSTGETLPADWPIDGTVGYEFLNAVNGLFVDPQGTDAIEAAYREFTGDAEPYAEALHDAKRLVERDLLASEMNLLLSQLDRAASAHRHTRDFTLNDLRRALTEVVACFRVYRTYLRPGSPLSAGDRAVIKQAVDSANERLPMVDASVFEFVRRMLELETPPGVSDDERAQWAKFVVRFQQTTGPVQAKGLEDTLFYRRVPLVSLNEVGGDPSTWGNPPSAFHALNEHRLEAWPGGLSTTATHDTKRGEDARIRISVISELSDEWTTRLARWRQRNAGKKAPAGGKPECPDAREEYLLYQTLIGAWPMEPGSEAPAQEFVDRVKAYMVKAVSEAKRNTSWIDPDPSYKVALAKFVGDVLTVDPGPFLKDFLEFQRRVARVAVVCGLSQAVLKLASPGPADVYQGCELWDFSMVDPDNRRPVDFEARAGLLASFRRRLESGTPRAELARALFDAPEDGAVKLFVVSTLLNHRLANPELYLRGSYRPLDTVGPHQGRLVAFARCFEGRCVIASAPRLLAGLMGEDGGVEPLGPDVWGGTGLTVSDMQPGRWRDVLTDRVVETRANGRIDLGDVFVSLPVAILASEPDDHTS